MNSPVMPYPAKDASYWQQDHMQPMRHPKEEIERMPILSKFYGIVIRMMFTRAFVAHFHAIYGQSELVVGIAPLRIIKGEAPGRVGDMVLEWAAAHERELLEAWRRCGAALPPLPIQPLY